MLKEEKKKRVWTVSDRRHDGHVVELSQDHALHHADATHWRVSIAARRYIPVPTIRCTQRHLQNEDMPTYMRTRYFVRTYIHTYRAKTPHLPAGTTLTCRGRQVQAGSPLLPLQGSAHLSGIAMTLASSIDGNKMRCMHVSSPTGSARAPSGRTKSTRGPSQAPSKRQPLTFPC